MLEFNNVFIVFLTGLKMAEKIPHKKKKILFLENILNVAKTTLEGMSEKAINLLVNKEENIVFYDTNYAINEACYIFLKINEDKTPYFHIKKTMHYKTEKVSAWDNKDCLTPEEALEYAQRYLPSDYDRFTKEFKV